MVFTTYGKIEGAKRSWSVSGAVPCCIAVGIGSQAVTTSIITLGSEEDRNNFTGGSVDIGTEREVSMQSDFNTVEMSGLTLTEFAAFPTSGAGTGSAFNVENFAGAGVEFDGTNELQIQIIYQTF